MEKNGAVIKGRGVAKVFKDFWGRDKVAALRGVDLDVPKGSVFGLLGPNGAGKSTLIKLLLGHLFPTAGQLSVLDRDPRDVAVKQRIGYLPERSYLYKRLHARETLHYFGAILNLSPEQTRQRTEQLLEMVGLQQVGRRMVGEFSHGMTRRLGLAQALLNDPDLLILDEPTAGLDPVGCREVKDLVLTLRKRGKTVLLTSHLLADVEDVCDEIVVLFGGRVQAKGAIRELLQNRDRTRLEFPNVSEAALAAARSALGRDVGEAAVEVSAPAESLESYFLRVVTESNARDAETGGARMGRGVAGYLREDGAAESPDRDEGLDRAALAELAADAAPEKPEPAPEKQVDAAAISALTGEAQKAPESAGDEETLDRGLLDELTRK